MPSLDSGRPASIRHLKQGALYLQRQVLDDPLFRLGAEPGEISGTVSSYLGLAHGDLDRDDLVSALRFLREVTPMCVAGYVHVLPLSGAFEPPKQVPLTASLDQFRELLPPDVLAWMRRRAVVGVVERVGGQMRAYPATEQRPDPRREIYISLDPEDLSQSQFFQLFEQRILSFDEETGLAKFVMRIPDDPPSLVEYDAWVEQSINQTAAEIYRRRTFEAGIARSLGAQYLTGSQFVFDLLRELHGVTAPEETGVAKEMLRLDLPVLEQIDTATLMRVRQEEGEAFANFRAELERRIWDLELIADPAARARKAELISRELMKDQVRAVQDEMAVARRKLAIGVAATVAALTAAFYTAGATAVVAAGVGSGATGLATLLDWKSAPRKLPGFFLWRAGVRSE
jgi:hypothetical protein